MFCVYNDDDNTTTTSFLMDLHESGADRDERKRAGGTLFTKINMTSQ